MQVIHIDPTSSKKIAEIIEAKVYGNLDVVIDEVSLDSRSNMKNCVFFAIEGKQYDGNSYIENAIENGAKLIVTSKEPTLKFGVSIMVVNDTKKALGLLSKALKGQEKIVGITGSVGKTTVKDMTKLVLEEKYSVNSTENNYNNEIGVPLTLFKGKNCDFNVIEMGMRGLGEIEWLSYISDPEISIITNVGSSHLERLKNKDNVFRAKTEIIKHTKKFAILPNENEFHSLDYGTLTPLFIGKGGDCFIDKIYSNGEMTAFDVSFKGELIHGIELNSISEHMAHNALFAISVGKICGIGNEDIRKSLKKYKGREMREEISQIGELTIINDCYNASYESMVASIKSAKNFGKIHRKNVIAVLGDMLELGEYSKEFHYRIGELSRDLGIKNIYATGEFGGCILDGFFGGEYFEDKNQIATALINSLNGDEVVLFKASRGIHLDTVITQMKELLK